MNSLPKLIAIGGVTASGKTSLSIEIAKKHNGSIVNCDSRQVYKNLDIGTAKETIEKRNPDGTVIIKGVTHHLIDFVEPSQDYSLAHFQKDAFSAIDSILKKGQLPLLAGGTGLYIDAIVYNFKLTGDKPSEQERNSLSSMTVEQLQERLQAIDEEVLDTLNTSDRNNPHRLIRAIERSASSAAEKRGPSRYDTLYLVLDLPDDELEARISKRVDQMFDDGLVAENEALRLSGLTPEHSALSSIGYREFNQYFEGNQTLAETKDLIILHTRQYAKRQRTWFRRNKDVTWIEESTDTKTLIEDFLTAS